MPNAVKVRKEEEGATRGRSPSREDVEQEEQSEEAEQSPDKAAIIQKLKAQGAVRVFPGMDAGSEAEAPVEAPKEPEAPASAPIASETSMETESAGSESEESGGISKEFHERVQKETDAANNPKWYDLPQHIENARYGKWDLSQSRERSGNRRQDANLEEDVRTNKIENRMMPGKFDVAQKAKNAINDAVQNPGQTAAGMIPIVGKGIQQKMAEKFDVKERDLLKGISATTTNEAIKTSTASQAQAVGTKITAGRIKAGIRTVTGLAGNIVPGRAKWPARSAPLPE